LIIFLKAFKDPFVTAAEPASRSSTGTRANLHKVEASEEGLLLSESAEYTAPGASATPISTTHPPIPPSATRAKLRFLPKNTFLEISKVNNIIT
jgi:hypothetical protein